MNKEIIPVENQHTSLAVELSEGAIAMLGRQREALSGFVKTQLKENVDFGTIPGTPKPTLFQPGAQKIANIFQLGSRVINSETKIDHDLKFIMCTYRIEVFHIPSGKPIAQCEASANSREKKYASQDSYNLINTLQKMSQKRAFVGCVLQSCNASDYFTQDLEDTYLGAATKKTYGSVGNSANALDSAIPEVLLKKNPKMIGMTWRDAADSEGQLFSTWIESLIKYEESKPDSNNYKANNLNLYTKARDYALSLSSGAGTKKVEPHVEDTVPF